MLALAVDWLWDDTYSEEAPTRRFAVLSEALDSGIGQSGLFPKFLPPSSYAIREKFDFGTCRRVVGFRFAPGEMRTVVASGQRMDVERLREVAPKWVGWKTLWFPRFLARGDVESFARKGYLLYLVGRPDGPRIVEDQVQRWYLAVDPRRSAAFVWY